MRKKFSVIQEEDFIISTWSGGTTEQIFIYPANAVYKNMDFLFRISRASVEISPSEFTQLPGIHRFIMPLDNELVLTHDNVTDIRLRPFETYGFSGDKDTISKSPAKDFNLMISEGIKGDMRAVYLEAGKPFIYSPTKSAEDIIECGENRKNESAEKYFTGFYTPDLGVIIKNEDTAIDLPANSLFLSESASEITLVSEMDSHIIMINIWI